MRADRLGADHGLRGDTSIGDRARFDNFYIENWSLWLDIKIILRTAISVFTLAGCLNRAKSLTGARQLDGQR